MLCKLKQLVCLKHLLGGRLNPISKVINSLGIQWFRRHFHRAQVRSLDSETEILQDLGTSPSGLPQLVYFQRGQSGRPPCRGRAVCARLTTLPPHRPRRPGGWVPGQCATDTRSSCPGSYRLTAETPPDLSRQPSSCHGV